MRRLLLAGLFALALLASAALPASAAGLTVAPPDKGYGTYCFTSGTGWAPCPPSVAGTAAAQNTANASIDTITLTAAGTAQQLPSITTTFGASLQNQSATDTIYVGVSSAVTSAGAHGYKLAPGQVLGVSAANLNAYWFNGPSTGSTLGYSVN